MLRDELVTGDVDQQVLLLEMFTDAAGDAAQQAHGRRGDRGLRDEDSGVEIVFIDKVVELADLLRAHAASVDAEINVDGTAVGLRLRV